MPQGEIELFYVILFFLSLFFLAFLWKSKGRKQNRIPAADVDYFSQISSYEDLRYLNFDSSKLVEIYNVALVKPCQTLLLLIHIYLELKYTIVDKLYIKANERGLVRGLVAW